MTISLHQEFSKLVKPLVTLSKMEIYFFFACPVVCITCRINSNKVAEPAAQSIMAVYERPNGEGRKMARNDVYELGLE